MVGTSESCSVLGYICLYLTFEFEVMDLNWRVGLLGHLTGTITRCIYIWPKVHSCCILVLLVLLVPCESELTLADAERAVLCAQVCSQARVPSRLDFGCVLCVHHANPSESATAVHPG